MILRLSFGWIFRHLQPTYWLHSWRMSRFDPSERERLQAAVWLTADSYIKEDDEKRFLQAVEDARRLGTLRARRLCGDGVFLPDALYANHLVATGKPKDAIPLYEDLIRSLTDTRTAGSRYQNPEERRNQDLSVGVLAILHCNLGAALAADGRDTGTIDQQFAEAVRYRPDSRFVRNEIANEYMRREAWDAARAAYGEGLRMAPPGSDGEQSYASNIANLNIRHAERLEKDGELDEAVGILERSLRDTERAAPGWAGRTYVTLARLYAALGLIDAASQAYREGAANYESAKDFSSASVVQGFLADHLLKQGRDRDALQAYEAAENLVVQIRDPKPWERKQRRDWLVLIGVLRLAVGTQRATEALEAWRRMSLEIDSWNPYYGVPRSLVRQPHLVGILRSHLDSELHKPKSEADARVLVDGLRGLWSEDLWEEKGEPHKVSTMINVITPIAFELEEGLIDTFGEDAILQSLDKLVRVNIEQHYGVRIPGIRVRALQFGLPGSYCILIHETMRDSGELRMDAMALVGTASVALPNVHTSPVQNSLMQDWRWVEPADVPAAKAAGVELLAPLDFLMYHLEHTLIANLVEVVAHQEVQNLLERNELVKPGESNKIVTMEAGRHMDPLTRVIRALVADRVPLTGFRKIYERYSELLARGAAIEDIAEDLRQLDAQRTALWGNDGAHALWMLGGTFEAVFDRYTQRPAVVGRRERDALLQAVRSAIADKPRTALVVARQRYRAFARALIARDFPHVPVLSRRELNSGYMSKLAGTIEIPSSRSVPENRKSA